MGIIVAEVSKQFGKFVALDQVSLEVPAGSLTALLGPSGSGKTTLLRIIAGLEHADRGSVHHQGEEMSSRSVRDRNVGFVFQHYALFRHMSVFENIAFGLSVRHKRETDVRGRVKELLQLIRLEGLGTRYPAQLSGGQRQRVALARAIAAEPKVLLLDEPFGALDAKVRQELRRWLRRFHDQVHVTSLFVTHDQEEAFEVADKVVVMRAGRIEQTGSPQEVFERPANAFVMDFLGNVNVFHGRVHRGRMLIGDLEVACPEYPHEESRPAALYVRPHELELHGTTNGDGTRLQAEVIHLNPAGSMMRVHLLAREYGLPIQVDVPHERSKELALRSGAVVYVSPRKVRVFVPDYVI